LVSNKNAKQETFGSGGTVSAKGSAKYDEERKLVKEKIWYRSNTK
jgi:hypothetical protein